MKKIPTEETNRQKARELGRCIVRSLKLMKELPLEELPTESLAMLHQVVWGYPGFVHAFLMKVDHIIHMSPDRIEQIKKQIAERGTNDTVPYK